MSISGISSTDYLYQYLYRISNTETDSLTSSQSKGTTTSVTGSSSGKDRIATELNALWEALQSGNLTNAQSYFAQLQQDVQAIGANASDSTQSTSAVSSSSSASDSNPLAKDLSALGEALQSGDLTSAQSIFSNILQHMQPPPPPPDFNVSDSTQSTSASTASLSSNDSNPLAKDLSALVEALQSGDLTSAQSALAQLQQDVQLISANASDSTQNTSTATASSSSSDSNPLAKDLSKLEEVLKSGDLTSAQTLFAQILQHMPPPPPDANASNGTQGTSAVSSVSSSSNANTLTNDLGKLEEALNSGDLTSAQTILAQIMQQPDAIASDSTQSAATSSLFSSGSSDMMSRLIEVMLAAYSRFNAGANDSKSYYA